MFGKGLLVGGHISGVWFGVYFRSCLGAREAQPHIEDGVVVGRVSVEFHGGMFYLDFGLMSFAFP